MAEVSERDHIIQRERLDTRDVKARLFETVRYRTYHPEVKRFHQSSARVKVCCAPARGGKSYSAGYEVLTKVLAPNTIGWIVAPNYGLAEKEFRVIHDLFKIYGREYDLPKPSKTYYSTKQGNLYMKFPWGATVEGKSSENPTSLLGEKVDWIIYSEAAQLKPEIRNKYCRPRLATRRGYEIIPTTPQQGAEWVYDLFMQGQTSNDLGIESFHWGFDANPEYSREEFDLAKRTYGEDNPFFREQYMGEWAFYHGSVYHTFDPKLHVIQPFDIPESWERIRAIDPGHRDPFVCLWAAVSPEGDLYFYREYYCRDGLSTKQHVDTIRKWSGDSRDALTVCDPSSLQTIEDMGYWGVTAFSANNDRKAGRLRVMEYLAASEDALPAWPYRKDERAQGRNAWPRMYFFSTMKETLREIKFYRWKEGKAIENDTERTEGEDHAMDAMRYLVMTRPSPVELVPSVKRYTWDWWADQADQYGPDALEIGSVAY